MYCGPSHKRRGQGLCRFLLALLICALIFAAGCSGGPAEKKGGPVTLNLVAWKPNRPGMWKELAAGFSRANPGVKVRIQIGPHSSNAFHDLLTQKLKNQSRDVDVFFMDVVWPAEFAGAGWARDLSRDIPQAERRKFLPGALAANTYQGKLYGLPLYTAAGLLYYRKDLLAAKNLAPPETWPELVRQAQALAVAAGGGMAGYTGQFKQYEGLVCNILEFIRSGGGGVLSADGTKCLLARKPALSALAFVRDRLMGKAAPRGVLTYQEPESLALFAQGKAVFLRSWPYAWAILNNPKFSTVAGKVGMAPLPAFPGGKSSPTLGGWQVGVSAFSPHPALAVKLARFLTAAAAQKRLVLADGVAPARKALYQDPEILAAFPHFKDLGPILASARPRPRTPLYAAVSNRMQFFFHQALSKPGVDLKASARRAAAAIEKLQALIKGK